MQRVGATADGIPAADDPFYRPVLPPIGGNLPEPGPADAKGIATIAKHKLLAIGLVSVALCGVIAVIVVVVVTRSTETSSPGTVCAGVTEKGRYKLIDVTGCSSSLASSVQQIASACDDYQDVGICSGEDCDECDKCCGPVFEQVTATCGGVNIPFSKVIGCTCQICDNFEIAISGRVIGDCAAAGSCVMSIQMDGAVKTVSDENGFFTFPTAYPSNQRIVITAVDNSGQYDTKTVVIQVSRDSQSYVNVEINVRTVPTPITFSATDGTSMNLGENEAVTVEIPAGSVVDENGNVYTGDVDLSMSFIDTADEDATSQISGELTVTVNGSATPLNSYGMFEMRLSSGSVGLSAKINVELSTDAIPENVDRSSVLVWEFIQETGEWVQSLQIPATTQDTRIRKGRQAARTSSVLRASIDISSVRRIYNLDSLVGSYCLMRVRIFEDEQATQSTNVRNVKLKAFYRTASGSWTNLIVRWSYSNGVCVNVPCDREGWTEVDKVHVTVPGYKIYEPHGVSAETQAMISYTPAGTNAFEITVPQQGSIPVDSNGPFFSKYNYDCYRSNNFAEESFFRFIRSSSTLTSTTMTTTTEEGNGSGSGDETGTRMTTTTEEGNGSGSRNETTTDSNIETTVI